MIEKLGKGLPPRPPYSDVVLDLVNLSDEARLCQDFGEAVSFSQREMDILGFVIAGIGSSTVIGQRLGLSKATINLNFIGIRRKLGTTDHPHTAAVLWSKGYVRIKEDSNTHL